MNYLELISKFWEHNKKAPVGASASIIYIFLVDKWYKRNYEDFVLSDIEISKELKLAINTIKAGKTILQNQGLIQFQTKNGLPCFYKLIINYVTPDDSKENKGIIVKKSIKKISKQGSSNNNSSPGSNSKTLESIPTKPNSIIALNPNIPSLTEFLVYAKNLKTYTPDLKSKIEEKYTNWIGNGWKNDTNRPITNWQQVLKNIIPYIVDSKENNEKEVAILPTIKRSNLIKN